MSGESGGEAAALDPSRLDSLREVDPSLVAEIAALWLDSTPTLVAQLRAAAGAADAGAADAGAADAGAADAGAAATAAHALRGSSANIGADALAAACAAVEDATRGGLAPPDLARLVDVVAAEHARAAAELAVLAGRA